MACAKFKTAFCLRHSSRTVTVKHTISKRYRLGINNQRTRRFCLSDPAGSKLISTQNRRETAAKEWFNARFCHIQIHDTYNMIFLQFATGQAHAASV